ncbi:MAG: hypothetical protein O6934_14020 [SAR324 cluster bacterium]|nr:hypothetical protein [SAR324 cluster bacterium]MCZ6842801.1 hypothetical protein [SAR324 cluster bacterium]
MRFIKIPQISSGDLLDWLANTDRMLVQTGRAAGLLALLGLIATGLYLKFSTGGTLLPYPALRVLHWLFALVILIECLCRLVMLVHSIPRGFRAARNGWPWPVIRARPSMRVVAGLGYWISLCAVLISGIEMFMTARYGYSLLPDSPFLIWSKIHGLGLYYLLAFLLLRLFYSIRDYTRRMRPYLYSP